MTKKRICFFVFAGMVCTIFAGCSPTAVPPSTTAEKEPGEKMGRPSVAGAGGGAAVPAEGAGANAETTDSSPAASGGPGGMRMIGGQMRQLPMVAGAGGGGGGAINPQNAGAARNNNASGGMNNGLFPVSTGGGGEPTTLSVTGFGALFPPADNASAGPTASTSTASGPGRPTVAGAGGAANSPSQNKSDETKAAPSTAVTLLDKAAKNFESGNEAEATAALYAYLLSEPNAFQEYPLKWYEQLQEPRVFLRWGIGVDYTPVKEYASMPPLIGDPVESKRAAPSQEDQLSSASSSGAISGAGDASKSKYGKVDTSTPAGLVLYYSGDYGEQLYKRLNDRRTGGGGYFGKILVNMPERKAIGNTAIVQQTAEAAQGAVPAFMRNRPSVAGAGGGGATPPPTPPSVGGAESGKTGANEPANAKKNTLSLVQRWTTDKNATEPSNSVTGSLMPGVFCLGEGKRDALLERAKRLGLDAVIVIDVKVQKSGKQFFSSTIIRVFDPKVPDKALVQSKALRNTVVMEDREKTSDKNDPVAVELDKVFQEFVDVKLKASDLPATMDATKAGERVTAILANPGDKIRSAVEIVGLFRLNLIDVNRAQAALNELLGGGGQVLLTGKDNDKKQFVESLVKDSGNSGGDSIR